MSYVTNKFDDEIVRLLKSGGVGFMPSDTIYGLSCLALNQEAVERLHKIKERQPYKPFIVLVADESQLKLLGISPAQVKPVKKYWPGRVTIICQTPEAPIWLELGTGTLAIRIPALKKLRELIQDCGPIISTSANPEDQEPAHSAAEAQDYFGEELNFYVDLGKVNGPPSTITKVAKGKLEVLRQGAVKINSEGEDQ